MRVPRTHIGQHVEVVWTDPVGGGARYSKGSAPKGQDALARWYERGVIDDITDGVVRIVHSWAPGCPVSPVEEIMATWVPEVLIEKVVLLRAVATEGENEGPA